MGLEYVSITLCKALIERLDELVEKGLFANRSQAVRAACWFFLGSGGHVSTIRCPPAEGRFRIMVEHGHLSVLGVATHIV